MAHNRHLIPGGEDQSFAQESQLLMAKGHELKKYLCDNRTIHGSPLWKVGLRSIWSFKDYHEIHQVIRSSHPEILHVQNTFPLMSPAVFHAAKREGVVTVMSLRNYRLYCLNAYFFRDGKVCELCINQPVPISGIYQKCYRDSLAGSLAAASTVSLHRLLRTYQKKVDMFIALTEFAREKFISHGIPAHKIRVKPNFIYPDPLPGTEQNDSVLYVGRLSPEKGVETLLTAWSYLSERIKLKIAGSGPLQEKVQAIANRDSNIEYLGQKPLEQIYHLLGQARALIFPSLWYEGMPRTIIESFAKGTPVIASNLGAMASMIVPERTGLHFEAGNAADLVNQVTWMLNHPTYWQVMRHNARQEFEQNYTAERNYEMLMDIYQQAIYSKRAQLN